MDTAFLLFDSLFNVVYFQLMIIIFVLSGLYIQEFSSKYNNINRFSTKSTAYILSLLYALLCNKTDMKNLFKYQII